MVAEDKAVKSRAFISYGGCFDHLKPVGLCYNLLHAWLQAQAQRWPSEGVSVQRDSDTTGKGVERKLKRVRCFPRVQIVLWLYPLGALTTWLLYFVCFLCGRHPITCPFTTPFYILCWSWIGNACFFPPTFSSFKISLLPVWSFSFQEEYTYRKIEEIATHQKKMVSNKYMWHGHLKKKREKAIARLQSKILIPDFPSDFLLEV